MAVFPIEDATKVYDRTADDITLDDIERIGL
jgi:hypothetical protein